jgi:hypothetical protein
MASAAVHVCLLLFFHQFSTHSSTHLQPSQVQPVSLTFRHPVPASAARKADERPTVMRADEQAQPKFKVSTNLREGLNQHSMMEGDNIEASWGEEPSEGADESESDSKPHALSAEDIRSQRINEAVTQCQTISLPEIWLRLQDFWPRRYAVTLLTQFVSSHEAFDARSSQSQNAWQFDIQEMRPEGEEYPAVDVRIRRLFAECLKKSQPLNAGVQPSHRSSFKVESVRAYSMSVEFDPSHPRIAVQGDMIQ